MTPFVDSDWVVLCLPDSSYRRAHNLCLPSPWIVSLVQMTFLSLVQKQLVPDSDSVSQLILGSFP